MEVLKSEFSFLEFLIEESIISRKPIEEKGILNIDVIPSGIIEKSKKIFQLRLDVSVSENNDRFKAKIVAIGLFLFNEISDANSLPDYFYINAPAIMFPFIRSYISALTALSGMESINLPIVRMANLVEKLKENTMELD